jgi:hypothetical protein
MVTENYEYTSVIRKWLSRILVLLTLILWVGEGVEYDSDASRKISLVERGMTVLV